MMATNRRWLWRRLTLLLSWTSSTTLSSSSSAISGLPIGTMEGHFAEWPAGQYNKAHAHGGGAVLYIVSGSGYTLMWPREAGIRPYEQGNEDKVIRAPWQEGAVVSP